MQRILLAEDEESLRGLLQLNLGIDGYDVTAVANGEQAVESASQNKYNLIILDVMMPGLDGFSACRIIRMHDTRTPILFLTARDQSADRIEGLKSGADDYLTKPFELEELLLRVKNLIRRSSVSNSDSAKYDLYTFGTNRIDFGSLLAQGQSEKRALTARESSLLKLLISEPNKVVSRDTILSIVWGLETYPNTRTIDNMMVSFRKLFEKDPKDPAYFHSVRGIGYMFTPEGR